MPDGGAARPDVVEATRALAPFGLEVVLRSGATLGDVDVETLHAWVAEHRLVVFKSAKRTTKLELVRHARRLGPLQAWPFGAVHEVEPKASPKNYLYTRRAVPLHWDGAFAGQAPRYLVFQCLSAPDRALGGETIFVDTTRVWERADEPLRDRLRQLRFTYETERVAHYGGRFTASVVSVHPHTHATVLRFAEPVVDVNPVHVRLDGEGAVASAAAIREVCAALSLPEAAFLHAWEEGDVLVADNHALLHGRRPFEGGSERHLWRVNVLDPPDEPSALEVARDMLRIRRPEFMVAEIPIFAIAALRARTDVGASRLAELVVLFFALFHFGDMANCLADRELDAVYKTRLAESVMRLGPDRVARHLVVTALVALGVAAHFAWAIRSLDPLALTAVGLVLGHQYSFGPVRFKSRGLLQVVALWAVIFVGPMLLVSRVLTRELPDLALFAAYGAMQQGTIAVNTAEDLPEDEDASIRTSAVALGLRGILALALVLVGGGGATVLAILGREILARGDGWPCVPFVAGWAWVLFELASLARKVRASATRDAALDHVRKYARRMPVWITVTAWGTLLMAAFAR